MKREKKRRPTSVGENGTTTLRRLLVGEETIAIPGVFNPAVAMLAQTAGFEALYFSGAAYSGTLGLPDLGLVTLTEVAQAVRQITSKVNLPIIVDVDTGFGEAVNVGRTVSEMEAIDAAAIQMEDQVVPKRCGHLAGKQLVAPEDMVAKLIAAKQAARRDLVLVARTDAVAVEGFDSAVERARLYARAGADVIFPEALPGREEFREFARKVDVPLLANMTEFGKTEYISVSEFGSMGYKFVIFPVTTFRVMMKAIQDALSVLSREGTQKGLLEKMMTRATFYDLIDYKQFESIDERAADSARKLTVKFRAKDAATLQTGQ